MSVINRCPNCESLNTDFEKRAGGENEISFYYGCRNCGNLFVTTYYNPTKELVDLRREEL